MPGIPRFKLPDFSVKISPVEPNNNGVPCIIALVINPNINSILFHPGIYNINMFFRILFYFISKINYYIEYWNNEIGINALNGNKVNMIEF